MIRWSAEATPIGGVPVRLDRTYGVVPPPRAGSYSRAGLVATVKNTRYDAGQDIGSVMAVSFAEFDEEKERVRLRKMSDEELIREGRAARYMCAPSTNFGKSPHEVYVIALRLC